MHLNLFKEIFKKTHILLDYGREFQDIICFSIFNTNVPGVYPMGR